MKQNNSGEKKGEAGAGVTASKPEWAKKCVRHSWCAATLALGAVAAMAILTFKQCASKPEPEGIMQSKTTCPAGQECRPPPQPCPQQLEGPDTYMDLCGNGKIDRNVKVVVFRQNAQKTAYEYSVENYTESCVEDQPNYCEADCPTKSRQAQRSSGGAGQRESESSTSSSGNTTTTEISSGGLTPCRNEIASKVCAEAMNSLTANAQAVRSVAGVDTASDVTVAPFTITIINGRPQRPTITLRPNGTYSGVRISARFEETLSCVATCSSGVVPGER